MTVLRIYCSLLEPPPACRWALVNDGGGSVVGEGGLATLPRHAQRVQVVLPASQVVFVRVRLPPAGRRLAGQALAFAVEDQTAGDPALNHVRWLGKAGDQDVLAVFDRAGFDAWRSALLAAGLAGLQWQAETLLLPRQPGRWHMHWNGSEGFVRTGEFEGSATDRGSSGAPPVSLHLLLAQARAEAAAPESIIVHPSVAEALPDLAAWSRELGIAIAPAAQGDAGDWTRAASDAGVPLGTEHDRWPLLSGLAARLRPAAWILGIALALQVLMLLGEWAAMANQQQRLRAQLEASFRQAFPDAVAVADPVLQMRRQLAQARHAAGQADPGDFLALVGPVGDATRGLPAGSLRALTYEGDRLAIELVGVDAASVRQIEGQLRQAGLRVETLPPAAPGALTRLTVRSP